MKTSEIAVAVGPLVILAIKILAALAAAMWTAYSPWLIAQINKRLNMNISQGEWDIVYAEAKAVAGRWIASQEPGWEKASIDVKNPLVARLAQDAIGQMPALATKLGLDNSSDGKLSKAIAAYIGRFQAQVSVSAIAPQPKAT